MNLYYKHINDFKIRNVKLLANRKKGLKFSVNLIGFDGTLKFKSEALVPENLFKIIDKMPMSQKVNVLEFISLNTSSFWLSTNWLYLWQI